MPLPAQIDSDTAEPAPPKPPGLSGMEAKATKAGVFLTGGIAGASNLEACNNRNKFYVNKSKVIPHANLRGGGRDRKRMFIWRALPSQLKEAYLEPKQADGG